MTTLQHSHALQDAAHRHSCGHDHGGAFAQHSMQQQLQNLQSQQLQQGIAFATPKTEDEQLDFLRRLLRDVQRERDEIEARNAEFRKRIALLETELASLRSRTAERDASVAWAIRRGRS